MLRTMWNFAGARHTPHAPVALVLTLSALGLSTAGLAVTLTPPFLGAHGVSFGFEAPADQLLTVQASDAIDGEWHDVSYLLGAGTPVEFSAALSGERRFFRVRSQAFQELALHPAAPVLLSGAVSLPDAVAGEGYSVRVSPALSGVPPYSLNVIGLPPDGVSLTVVSNATAAAAVALSAEGAGLIAGQRRQFQIVVTDSRGHTNAATCDLRVIPPPPQVTSLSLVVKAGEAVDVPLAAVGGVPPLDWRMVESGLPAGLQLTEDGRVQGTPSADAAERFEHGRYTNAIVVSDQLTDRVTGELAPRATTHAVSTVVRLSYRLNIYATRPEGPSLGEICLACHDTGFSPDFETGTAGVLLNAFSGSGAECGTTRVYVVPGDPTDSLIFEKLSEQPPCGARMPLGGPYLTDLQRARLERWIRELTPADGD